MLRELREASLFMGWRAANYGGGEEFQTICEGGKEFQTHCEGGRKILDLVNFFSIFLKHFFFGRKGA